MLQVAQMLISLCAREMFCLYMLIYTYREIDFQYIYQYIIYIHTYIYNYIHQSIYLCKVKLNLSDEPWFCCILLAAVAAVYNHLFSQSCCFLQVISHTFFLNTWPGYQLYFFCTGPHAGVGACQPPPPHAINELERLKKILDRGSMRVGKGRGGVGKERDGGKGQVKVIGRTFFLLKLQ